MSEWDGRSNMSLPQLIAFGRGYSLPCCPLSNVFEATTGQNEKTGQTDRWTDERIAELLYVPLP